MNQTRKYRTMDLIDEIQKMFSFTAQIGSLVLLLLWHILHAIVNLWCFVRRVYHVLESSLIDSGYLKMYRNLNLDSLHNLAIVVDSEEAHKTFEVIQLLQWVAAIGVRNVCLYDTKGVLKKSKEIILEKLCVPKVSEDVTTQLLEQKAVNLEFASFSDGKEAVARAANVLLAKHYLGGETAPLFTESHVAEALTTVGSGGPNPELLLVYGPARCHQGFPSWRIRYTEIIFDFGLIWGTLTLLTNKQYIFDGKFCCRLFYPRLDTWDHWSR